MRAVCLAVFIPFAAHAQWTPQHEAGIVYDSNFSRAQREQDVLSVGADARLVRFTRARCAARRGALSLSTGRRFGERLRAARAQEAPTAKLVRELGCDQMQGWLVARPLEAAAFETWLAAHAAGRVSWIS